MFTHLLVATDGSERSERAVRHGADLASKLGAKLSIVTVMSPTVPQIMAEYPSLLKITGDTVGEAIQVDARSYLASAKDIADELAQPAETFLVLDTFAWRGILETVSKLGCDGVLMASHGRGGAAAVLLGSETAKVLAHAHVPVIVVR
ncbi:MAG: universal stress protein [Aquimonas sp.]|nr:universal stress protein [Aquimonas sp.]